MRQLQGSDASFVARETRNSPMHIGSIMIYDPSTAPGGVVRFDDLLAFFAGRLHLSKTVRERLVRVPFDLDYPYWVEDEGFDLEYHVRHVALPRPGGWEQLCTLAARLFSRPLDLRRPPWEFTMIEGLGEIPGIAPGSYAMITKVHHAAIDGLSGIDLMEALHTLTPDAGPPQTRDRWQPEPVPSGSELLGRFLVNTLRHPVKRVQVAVKAAPGLARIVRGLVDKEFSIGDMIGPKTRFNSPLSPHRVVEGRRLPLSEVKTIRALAPGCRVNDVFLAIVGGALRRYLLAKRDLPQKPLTALVPISVRSRDEKGSMGNQVAAMIVSIGTHLADPAERLQFVHAKTKSSKAMTNALGARNMSEISKVSPALFLAMGAQLNAGLGFANQRRSPPYSTVVTNVPGPRVPLYSAGARLETMIGLMCLTEGMALAHVVQSYLREATISFTADRELMPDPEFYAECIDQSFAEMVAAAQAAKRAAAAAKLAEQAAAEAETVEPRPGKRTKPAKSPTVATAATTTTAKVAAAPRRSAKPSPAPPSPPASPPPPPEPGGAPARPVRRAKARPGVVPKKTSPGRGTNGAVRGSKRNSARKDAEPEA